MDDAVQRKSVSSYNAARETELLLRILALRSLGVAVLALRSEISHLPYRGRAGRTRVLHLSDSRMVLGGLLVARATERTSVLRWLAFPSRLGRKKTDQVLSGHAVERLSAR